MDTTENVRREMQAELNAAAHPERAATEAQYGQCWTVDELTRDFEVIGFAAPLVVVRRKADGVKGSLMFQHSPRLYFRFEPA
jgi:hypothetical protein